MALDEVRPVRRAASAEPDPPGRWGRGRAATPPVLFVVGLGALIVGYLWWERTRDQATWVSAEPVTGVVDPRFRPARTRPPSTTPLGEPVGLPASSGTHRFIATQPGSAEPVTYDPCRPIQVVVNERGMPHAAAGMLDAALAEIADITGLHLTLEGTTDEAPTEDREAFQPHRYGDRWAPVLVAWTDSQEVPRLGGEVTGLAGSQRIRVGERWVYVTGLVLLDGAYFAEALAADGGFADAHAVLLHELAHLVGLDHVGDEDQLMHHHGGGAVEFADGDLTGLSLLGRGRCVPSL